MVSLMGASIFGFYGIYITGNEKSNFRSRNFESIVAKKKQTKYTSHRET